LYSPRLYKLRPKGIYHENFPPRSSSACPMGSKFFRERKFQFLLTGRLTQDCVENLFSVLRSKNVTLNALQFKNNLKLIAISLYMRSVPRSNYEDDDAQYIPGFLDLIEHKSKFCNKSYTDLPYVPAAQEVEELNYMESNILYSVAGYIVTSIKKNTTLCKYCIQSLGSTHRNLSQHAKLTRLRNYKNNTLFFVNNKTFEIFKKLEYVFRQYQKSMCNNNRGFKNFLVDKFYNILYKSHILSCHNLHIKIANRYAIYRMRIANKKKIVKHKYYDSKSMAMHSVIK